MRPIVGCSYVVKGHDRAVAVQFDDGDWIPLAEVLEEVRGVIESLTDAVEMLDVKTRLLGELLEERGGDHGEDPGA